MARKKKTDSTKWNIICISDIHFGKKDDKKLFEMLKEEFLEQIPIIIDDVGKINMITINGDLYDRIIKMNETASNYVIKFISELCELSEEYGFYLRLIKGTQGHDFNQLNNFLYLETKYPLFKIILQAESEELEGHKILYLPEEYPEDYKKYYSKLFKDKYDFCFGHGMIDFVAFTGDEEIKKKIKRNEAVHEAKVLDKIVKYFCIFGHIHDFKNYKDKDKIMYTGSFERFSFADQEDKGFLFLSVDFETEEKEATFYQSSASTYEIINLNDSDFEDMDNDEILKYIQGVKEEYDYVKVIMKDGENENNALLKNVMDSGVKVESHTKIKEEVVDEKFRFLLNREFPIDVSIAKFIALTTGQEISTETINKFISNPDNA